LGRAKPLADHERATGRRARHLRATTLSSVPDTLIGACGSPALPARRRAAAELAWVSSSNFGRFDRNLNTGRRPGFDAQRVSAGQTVYHDAQRPSHLTLPLVPAHD
jgi:hypothetical protein